MSVISEKERREQCIFQLLESRSIGTQSELVTALTEAGFEVTQATVSRDMRRLGLLKTPQPDGGFRYTAPRPAASPTERRGLSNLVTGLSQVQSLYLLTTLPGRAMSLAINLDEMNLPEIAGTLAGDDVVLVMFKSPTDTAQAEALLSELL